jgi:tetratricopeptide (TPR) repeat protein
MIRCPGPEVWERAASGACDADEASVLREHEMSCAACAALADSVRSNLRIAGVVAGVLRSEEPGTPGRRTVLGLVGMSFDGRMIERVLGSGGSATVYEAVESRSGRRVALKVLSTTATSAELVRRFDQEIVVLSRLDHPGIAQVLGWGRVPDDAGCRPYIAMELVNGSSITRSAADRAMGTRERIDLIAQACEAVAYAHTMGVLHRDLKPGNVLVDADGRVKIVDFGFARVVTMDVSSMHTTSGQIVGTAAYMSPEHTEGAIRVDARSDVYALGVIAYELLVGRHPLTTATESIESTIMAIRRSEPERPSRVRQELAGEAETVMLRAIEKRPQDRYQTAAAFASDLRRLQAGQPIAARPATTIARTAKFVRRHRSLVIGAASVFVALCIGLVGTSLGLLRAVERSREAEQRQREAEQLASLMEEMLREAHPHEARGRGYTVRQMLDGFEARFHGTHAGRLDGQPRVEASLRSTMGAGYRVLGDYPRARRELERSLGILRDIDPSEDRSLARVLCELAWLAHDEGDYDAAMSRFREAIELRGADAETMARATLGWSDCLRHSGDFDGARDRGGIALRQAIFAQESGERVGPLMVAEARLNLSRIERDAGDYAAADRELAAAMDLLGSGVSENDPRLADALNDQAWLEFLSRDVQKAEATARRALDLGRGTLGDDHPDVGNSLYELGMIVASRGDRPGGEAILRESVDLFVRAHGELHPSTFTAREALARVLRTEGRSDEAARILESVIDGRRAYFGADNVEVAYALSAIGPVRRDLGDLDGAESSLREAITIYRGTFGDQHPFISNAQRSLAGVLAERGDPRGALALRLEAARIAETTLGPRHPDTLRALREVAVQMESMEQWDEAALLYAQIIERCDQPSLTRAGAMIGRGRCLAAIGRSSEGVKALDAAIAELEGMDGSSMQVAEMLGTAREARARVSTAATGD